jgi:hypothetical protein
VFWAQDSLIEIKMTQIAKYINEFHCVDMDFVDAIRQYEPLHICDVFDKMHGCKSIRRLFGSASSLIFPDSRHQILVSISHAPCPRALFPRLGWKSIAFLTSITIHFVRLDYRVRLQAPEGKKSNSLGTH